MVLDTKHTETSENGSTFYTDIIWGEFPDQYYVIKNTTVRGSGCDEKIETTTCYFDEFKKAQICYNDVNL